jgi:hypothetical protein
LRKYGILPPAPNVTVDNEQASKPTKTSGATQIRIASSERISRGGRP